jgi:hypothetical protein
MVGTFDPSRRDYRPSNEERLLLAVLLGAFLVVNFVTVARMPTPWGDEIMLVDPVANWYYGRGFVTGTWNIQRSNQFFAGYPPLYHLIMVAWVSVLGFGRVVVRSLDLVLATLVGVLLWCASWRLEMVATARHRLLLVAAALGGYGIFIAYRSVRPDSVGMSVCLASLLASRLEGRARVPVLFGLGVLLPLAGLQTVFYAAVMYSVLILFWPRPAFRAALPQAFGALAGASLLLSAYSALGVLHDFLAQTVQWQTAIGRVGVYDLRHRLGALRDPSALVVFATLLVTTVLQWRDRTWHVRSPAFVGTVIGVVVPVCLFAMAKIPIYYVWMPYLPMTLCLAAVASRSPGAGVAPRRWFSIWCGCAFVVCTAAVPLFTAIALLQWHQRDPERVAAVVVPQLRPDDRVLLEPAAYYAALNRVATIYDKHYSFTEPEARAVTVVIAEPWLAAEYQKQLGGRWTDTGAALDTQDEWPQFPPVTYILLPTPSFRIYRRAD